jgi:drug/metabolite transporter (DMT)-like permease
MSDPAPDPDSSARRRAAISLAIGVFGIAWSAILVRWSGVSGLVSAFYRLAFASLVFVPWVLLSKRRRTTPAPPAAKRAAIIAGVLFGADLAFFNTAVMETNAANAALLGVNAPIFVALGAWIMDGVATFLDRLLDCAERDDRDRRHGRRLTSAPRIW